MKSIQRIIIVCSLMLGCGELQRSDRSMKMEEWKPLNEQWEYHFKYSDIGNDSMQVTLGLKNISNIPLENILIRVGYLNGNKGINHMVDVPFEESVGSGEIIKKDLYWKLSEVDGFNPLQEQGEAEILKVSKVHK